MAVIPDPRPSYHEEPHNLFPGPHDPSSATDTVGALWVLVPAVAAVLVLIWLVSATTLQPPPVGPKCEAHCRNAIDNAARPGSGDAARTNSLVELAFVGRQLAPPRRRPWRSGGCWF
jgi:hypothetical protein